jgi:hypothetical protein
MTARLERKAHGQSTSRSRRDRRAALCRPGCLSGLAFPRHEPAVCQATRRNDLFFVEGSMIDILVILVHGLKPFSIRASACMAKLLALARVALPFGCTCPPRLPCQSGVGESARMDPPKKSKSRCDSRTLGANLSTTTLSTTGEPAHHGRNQTESRARCCAIQQGKGRIHRPIGEATEIRCRAAFAGQVEAGERSTKAQRLQG